MPRPKLRTAELRDAVLREAHRTLESHGVGGFTARRLAAAASTSVPAVYELFGDKAGVVRELFFDGFRRLGDELDAVPETADARADLEATVSAFRRFVLRQPELARVMFARPFADFDPGPRERVAGASVRTTFVRRVQRWVEAGIVHTDATDVAHVLLALVQGLAAQEAAGWLGTSRTSVERRWRLGVTAVLDGCASDEVIPTSE